MSKITHPYELLVRWDEQGKVAGASLATRTTYPVEDGDDDPRPPKISEPQHLELDAVGGWLDQAQADALSQVATLRAQAEADAKTIEELQASVLDAAGKLAAADATIASLSTALTGEAPTDG